MDTFCAFDTRQGLAFGPAVLSKVQYNETLSVFSQKAHQARTPTNSNPACRALEQRRAGGWRGGEEARSFEREAGAGEGRVLKPYILTLAGRELISRSCLLGSVVWSTQSVGLKNYAQIQPHMPPGHPRQLREPVGLTTGGRSAG